MTKFSQFDASEYLTDEKTIAEYIATAAQDGDPRILISALEDVVKARGMARVAEDAGLGRASFYKVFRESSKPQFDTVYKIFKALNLRMVFVPEKFDESENTEVIAKTAVPKNAVTTKTVAASNKPAAPKVPRRRKNEDRHVSA